MLIGFFNKSIDESAFSRCTSLKSITIPKGVTSIGKLAFSGCTSLKDIYYKGSESDWGKIAIGGSNEFLNSATIHYNSK